MATYKVSYKMLAKQGEELKAAAKLVDGYAERVNQIRGKLGEDQMFTQVRNNLQKLGVQLGESRTVLNTAGELLGKTVESYTGTETRQVKKVDNLKAHNRDFYKNPVVVASAGGASYTASAAGQTGQSSQTTVNYTDNSINVQNVTAASYTDGSGSASGASGTGEQTAAYTAAAGGPSASAAPAPEALKAGMGAGAGIAAGAGALSGAAGAGAVLGAKHLNGEKKRKEQPEDNKAADASRSYDPEKELAAAIERVHSLERED